MKKQTAIDWLHHQLIKNIIELQRDFKSSSEIWEKAKDMEKEQIEYSYDSGMCEGFDMGYKKEHITDMTGEQFYKENYK